MQKFHRRLRHSFLDAFGDTDDEYLSRVQARAIEKPDLVSQNNLLALDMGLDKQFLEDSKTLDFFCGNSVPDDIQPIALVYSGHQFGVWAGQLGDGRALTLGELDIAGELWDVQLKGAGTTPYSRFGDGRAVLRSSIREYLCSEAMHALDINSTRALCLINSSTPVYRESIESAAVVCRVARSHIRFGSFEHHHYRGQTDALKALANYVVERHFPGAEQGRDGYRLMFHNAVLQTARTIAKWQAVGFSHGVMNTDNMSILGDTIDYGPFGFMDHYDAAFICNHSDERGRYAFKNQPSVALWNLNALATALSSLLPSEILIASLECYEHEYQATFLQQMANKLGFSEVVPEDKKLVDQLLSLMQANRVDYCKFFRALCNYHTGGDNRAIRDLFLQPRDFDDWSVSYRKRLNEEALDTSQRAENMLLINPKFILRNYIAQEAIDAAQGGDYRLTQQLLTILQAPFQDHTEFAHYAGTPPDWASALSVSCSS
ncbi:MAG: YdiU family protein [Porticoccaceae bacterium]|nr:YdiU family protein [Porticoccaceae bacterium]